jgi:plasmid stability protein
MRVFKRLLLLVAVFSAVSSFVLGQNRSPSTNQEMSVEQSYLQQSVEIMIIREMSRAETRDMKLVALEYIGNAIDKGNTGEEVRSAVEYLGMEGISYITRENGRVVNNYPDIRVRAATYLGQIGTPEAKNALIKMVLADNEPMVITEAIKSLAKIGLNQGGETENVISWVVNRYDVLHPDDMLAISAIEAFEKLAEANGEISSSAIQTLVRISDGHYNYRVKERARISLNDLRQYQR